MSDRNVTGPIYDRASKKYVWFIKDDTIDISVGTPEEYRLIRDPVTGKSVQDAINSFIAENIGATKDNLISGVDNIWKRAKTAFQKAEAAAAGQAVGEPLNNAEGYRRDVEQYVGAQAPLIENVDDLYSPPIRQETAEERFKRELSKESAVFENFYNDTKPRQGLQETVSGTDLAVFYMAEAPVIADVVKYPDNPELWRKELINIEMDNVLSISYSTIRERFPVRQLGKSNPVAYTMGPRTIAGHIAFAVFAEDVLSRLRSRVLNAFDNLFNSSQKALWANEDPNIDISSEIETQNERFARLYELYDAALQFDNVQLLDSLPPFHILVIGVNEQGILSKFILKNVNIIDENQYQGTRQPNIVNKCSFIAGDIIPMTKLDNPAKIIDGSLDTLAERNIRTNLKPMTITQVLKRDLDLI